MTKAREGTKTRTGKKPVPPPRRPPRAFGKIRKLPSGKLQASVIGPDGVRRPAPETFRTRQDAEAWLAKQQTAIGEDTWRDETTGKVTFGEYAVQFITERDLKPRTRGDYRRILDRFLLPAFGTTPLRALTPAMVRSWHVSLGKDTPVMRAHAYGLLRTITRAAVADDLITASPCRVRGGGQVKRKVQIRPASLAELEVITAEMPDRLQMLVLLAAWCGLRFGELTELRRRDVDLDREQLHVRRGVVRAEGHTVVDTPKTAAGVRTISIPPHLLEPLQEHLAQHVGRHRDALLFTRDKTFARAQKSPTSETGHLPYVMLWADYDKARRAAGRPDLRLHDLRHTGATLAAATGATIADLMHRLGHSTAGAAMRYQHASQDRDKLIASALSDFAIAKVVELRPRKAADR